MKKLLVLIISAFSILFFACEEDAIPIPLPPTQPSADAPAPVVDEKVELPPPIEKTSEPAKAPAKETVKKEPPAKKEPPVKTPAPIYWGDDLEQPSKGRYVIQVGIVPAEVSAKKMIKKLAENGIKAYNAKVQNPDPDKGMIGTYNRVRIGFFDSKANAEAFAKARLEPLGYSWWVDRSKNDYVGKLASSEAEPVFEVERIPEKSKQMSEQEIKDAERAAAIAAAKEEYKAIAKAANAAVATPATVPPPSIPAKTAAAPPVKTAAAPPAKSKAEPPPAKTKKTTPREAEIDTRGKVKMKNKK